MSHKIFWLIIILATIGIGIVVYFKSQTPGGLPIGLAPIAPAQLAADYENQSATIVSDYLAARQNILQQGDAATNLDVQNQLRNQAAQTKTSLLALRVPEQYRGLHLQLVLIFTAIEMKAATDYPAVMAQDANLDILLGQYPWLATDQVKADL